MAHYFNTNYSNLFGHTQNTRVFVELVATGDVPHNYLPTCKYGASCYRKNLDHLSQFSHPHKNCIVKINHTFLSSNQDLLCAIRSNFDCTNTTFTLHDEFSQKIQNFNPFDFASFYSEQKKITIYVNFTTINPWKIIKSCSYCCKTICDNFYYECNHCSNEYILCSACEACDIHTKNHIFSKIYCSQQDCPRMNCKEDKSCAKLDEIIDKISDLKLNVTEIKEKQENTINIKQTEQFREALKTLSGMGFRLTVDVLDLVAEQKCDIEAILDKLVN